MNIKLTTSPLPENLKAMSSSGAGLLFLAGVAFVLAASSSNSEAATLGKSSPKSVTAGLKSETDNYTAQIKPVGTYKAGAQGTVEVTIVPKGDYHINDQYPYKFKTADPAPEGISYPKPVLQRADGVFEEKKGMFMVPFVAAKAGKATVGGTLSLSVCSENNCVVDKVPLEVSVDVK